MIKTLGICALLIAAVLIRSEMCCARREHLLLCEELYRFVLHMRNRISCFLCPPPELCDGFDSDLFERSGFFERIRSGESLSAAFLASGIEEKLTDSERRVICGLFSKMGRGYLDEEIKHIDLCAEELLRLLGTARESTAREIKLITTLTASISLGIVILLL